MRPGDVVEFWSRNDREYKSAILLETVNEDGLVLIKFLDTDDQITVYQHRFRYYQDAL